MEKENKVYDLKKRAYRFALDIIHLLEFLPKDYISVTMGKQLLRSATSVGANIIEAQAASSRKDFTNFYNHALKSANESKYWLNLLRDSNKVEDYKAQPFLRESNELSKILAASILKLKGKRES